MQGLRVSKSLGVQIDPPGANAQNPRSRWCAHRHRKGAQPSKLDTSNRYKGAIRASYFAQRPRQRPRSGNRGKPLGAHCGVPPDRARCAGAILMKSVSQDRSLLWRRFMGPVLMKRGGSWQDGYRPHRRARRACSDKMGGKWSSRRSIRRRGSRRV